MADLAQVANSLAEPNRRRILELLRDGERSVRDLTDELPITQPAVSQHLRALRDARLVDVRADGTRRLYRIDVDGLGPLRAWVDSFWDDALTAFTADTEQSHTDQSRTDQHHTVNDSSEESQP